MKFQPIIFLILALASCVPIRSSNQEVASSIAESQIPLAPDSTNSDLNEPTNPDDFFIISGSLQFVEFYSDT